jgi:hypothetical protein
MPKVSNAIADNYLPSPSKKLIDLTGERFGRWLVVGRAPAERGTRWLCRCDCGNEKAVESPSLRRGLSTSCGCISTTHGGYGTRLYRIWANMLNRCRNPNVKAYKDYGARGIAVCDAWLDFANFKAWAEQNDYADNLTIERIDVNGGYVPRNCQWMPMSYQSANRRTTKRSPEGRPWCEIANEHGVSTRRFNSRVSRGWTEQQAATLPLWTKLY